MSTRVGQLIIIDKQEYKQGWGDAIFQTARSENRGKTHD